MNVESFRELRGALECRHGAADGWSGESSEEEHSECYFVSLLKVKGGCDGKGLLRFAGLEICDGEIYRLHRVRMSTVSNFYGIDENADTMAATRLLYSSTTCLLLSGLRVYYSYFRV